MELLFWDGKHVPSKMLNNDPKKKEALNAI
jgi:hypothetical protein